MVGRFLRAFESLLVFTSVLLYQQGQTTVWAQKVAVIGGAVGGSFATKYLVDYDANCEIDTITVFEPKPIELVHVDNNNQESNKNDNDDFQGSRLMSLQLDDGTVVELGASVGHKNFHLVMDMIKNDPAIHIGKPFNTGNTMEKIDSNLRQGLGIYDGNGQWPLLTARIPSFLRSFVLLWRYNFDLIQIDKMASEFLERFDSIPDLLASRDPSTFYKSPDALWDALGIRRAVHSSFAQMLDAAKITDGLSWWRKLLPFQGSVRSEFLDAINLVNYNQDIFNVNGLVGFGSFFAASADLFSVTGGNYQIIQSAMRQAEANRDKSCAKAGRSSPVQEVDKAVTTVVGTSTGLAVYTGETLADTFDIIILAVPIQHSRIKFLLESDKDEAVLVPLPLGGTINPHTDEDDESNPSSVVSHGGHELFARELPLPAQYPYTQVVTTIVSNGTLSADYLGLGDESSLPRSVITTSAGKAALHNITAITHIKSSTGLHKVFSDERLGSDVLTKLFGPDHRVEYVKVWGGPHGGATPDYRGTGISTDFLLYDGAAGLEGFTYSGAIYHTSPMEQSTLSSIELAAIGARAVTKLVARRLNLIEASRADDVVKDEL